MLIMFRRRYHEREKVTGNETNHRFALIFWQAARAP